MTEAETRELRAYDLGRWRALQCTSCRHCPGCQREAAELEDAAQAAGISAAPPISHLRLV